jgi:hypothetical protein
MSVIVTRAGKGSPLTHNEVDANFNNLNSDKYQSGDSPTFATVTATSINLTNAVVVSDGGTGLTSTPTNGQLLIGNGTGYTLATITAGTGISVTNGSGSITINATGGGGGGGGGEAYSWFIS